MSKITISIFLVLLFYAIIVINTVASVPLTCDNPNCGDFLPPWLILIIKVLFYISFIVLVIEVIVKIIRMIKRKYFSK